MLKYENTMQSQLHTDGLKRIRQSPKTAPAQVQWSAVRRLAPAMSVSVCRCSANRSAHAPIVGIQYSKAGAHTHTHTSKRSDP